MALRIFNLKYPGPNILVFSDDNNGATNSIPTVLIADKIRDPFGRQRFELHGGEREIDRVGQIRARIDERPVEVETDGLNYRRHGISPTRYQR